MFQKVPYDLSGLVGSASRQFWVLQREYNWQLIMPHDIGGWIGPIISQYCQSVRFGDYAIERINELRYGPEKRFYAGLRTIGHVTLSFLVPIDSGTVSYFHEWHNLIVDEQLYYHPKQDYAKDMFIIMYDVTGVESILFRLKGCWPKNKPEFGLGYDKDGAVRFDMTMVVDKIDTQMLIGSAVNKIHGVVSKGVDKLGGIFS